MSSEAIRYNSSSLDSESKTARTIIGHCDSDSCYNDISFFRDYLAPLCDLPSPNTIETAEEYRERMSRELFEEGYYRLSYLMLVGYLPGDEDKFGKENLENFEKESRGLTFEEALEKHRIKIAKDQFERGNIEGAYTIFLGEEAKTYNEKRGLEYFRELSRTCNFEQATNFVNKFYLKRYQSPHIDMM